MLMTMGKRKTRILNILLCLALIMAFSIPSLTGDNAYVAKKAVKSGAGNYLVGTGIYDITGPAAEAVMMGMAKSDQQTAGIHTRLRSRAFIIVDPNTGKRVVFVSTDLGQVFLSVREGVIKKLQAKYGDLYSYENVLMNANHTHSGPGGYSYYALYNISCLGFDKENYNCIVDGIYNSIKNAHDNLEPGDIYINSGRLDGTSINRSLPAYETNPAEERSRYEDNVDKTMTLIKLVNSAGTPIGELNWFGVHNTSFGHDNLLISSDNKGYAEYLFEKEMKTNYTAKKTFVAAFTQGAEGDSSPNINGGEEGYGTDDFQSCAYAGEKQYTKAKELFTSATTKLAGGIDYRHQWVDMWNVQIDGKYTGNGPQRTYPAAVGYSQAAGAEDGPSDLPFFKEGMVADDYPITGFLGVVQFIIKFTPWFGPVVGTNEEAWEQQYPKPVLFSTATGNPDPWTPQVIPVQIIKIGQLYILGVPSEITTMASRRLTETVKNTLEQSTPGCTVVVAGLANAYEHYISTPEEYTAQHYEGACTHFGKWTLPAYIQEFDELAQAMVNNTTVDSGPTPADISTHQVSLGARVVWDDVPLGKKFGSVAQNANAKYKKGDNVVVKFWGGHLRNNFKTQSSFLRVEKLVKGKWVPVAYDWDVNTILRWERKDALLGTSQVTVEWQTDSSTEAGTYRVTHDGYYKDRWTGKIKSYTGVSRVFMVN